MNLLESLEQVVDPRSPKGIRHPIVPLLKATLLGLLAGLTCIEHISQYIAAHIYSQNLQSNTGRFYRYAIKTALNGSRHLLAGANIKIDGHGGRTFNRQFEAYLRKELVTSAGQPTYSKLSFVRNSGSNALIQLADMCAGAINRSFSEKPDAHVYRGMIQEKIASLWDFQ